MSVSIRPANCNISHISKFCMNLCVNKIVLCSGIIKGIDRIFPADGTLSQVTKIQCPRQAIFIFVMTCLNSNVQVLQNIKRKIAK